MQWKSCFPLGLWDSQLLHSVSMVLEIVSQVGSKLGWVIPMTVERVINRVLLCSHCEVHSATKARRKYLDARMERCYVENVDKEGFLRFVQTFVPMWRRRSRALSPRVHLPADLGRASSRVSRLLVQDIVLQESGTTALAPPTPRVWSKLKCRQKLRKVGACLLCFVHNGLHGFQPHQSPRLHYEGTPRKISKSSRRILAIHVQTEVTSPTS